MTTITLPVQQDTQDWARGCDKCKYGIVASPPLTRACDLHMERLIQMIDKQLQLCDCKAGVRYHSYLRNRFRILFEEAKQLAAKDLHMAAAAMKKSHPDTEIARAAIERSYEMMPAPTVHLEGI